MLGIYEFALGIDPEAFGEGFSAGGLRVAGFQVDGFACELAIGLG